MIKPINISPLNTTDTIWYRCEKCSACGTIKLSYTTINIDDEGNPVELSEYECPKCEEKL